MKTNPVLEYAAAIESGEIVTSRRVAAVYKRLAAEIHDYPERFSLSKALKPIRFIETFCKHSKGALGGQPFKLALWQRAFIAALFGFIDPDTGYRRYRETLCLMARKNGKSTLASAAALFCFMADGEKGAQVATAATKRDQAKLIFDEAHNMVKQSAALSAHVRKRKTDLYFPATLSTFQPLGANYDTLDGLNLSCCVIDELHEVKRPLYEVLKQSQSARTQPLLIMTTTAGTNRESVYDSVYEYACKVADGIVDDPTFLPILYELDARSEWDDPKAWIKANPNLGISKSVDDLRVKVERAKVDPSSLSGLLCKDFDVRETRSTAWLTFDAIHDPDSFDLESFRGCYAIGGADLSRTTDLTAAALLLMDSQGRRYVTSMCWLPEQQFNDRVQTEHIPYDKWRDMGYLRLCAGNTIDYKDVTAWFLEAVNEHGITPLWTYFDSWSARYWVDEMEANGFEMVRAIQGAKTLSLPMQQLGADLQAGLVNYGANPLMEWCLTNVGVQSDRNGNIVPVKASSPKRRIDAAMALLDCYVGLLDHMNEFQALNTNTDVKVVKHV
nr:MAG TPA: Large Terminase [Caudoviricetes sp.]